MVYTFGSLKKLVCIVGMGCLIQATQGVGEIVGRCNRTIKRACRSFAMRSHNKKNFLTKEVHEIDVVIPCHKDHLPILNLCINGIRTCGKNVRRIIVVSEEKLTDQAEWFPESNYPFSKDDILNELFCGDRLTIEKYKRTPKTRTGWIFQQLLKLYAPFVIPDISSNVLVLDADVVFLRKVEFFDKDGNALFNCSSEHWVPYFEHAGKLIEGRDQIKRVFKNKSGICHHMIFQKSILEDLFKDIRATHGIEPWRAICRCIDHSYLYDYGSSMSEYEIYFNFVFAHRYPAKIRLLRWINIGFDVKDFSPYKIDRYHYVACQAWLSMGKVSNMSCQE